MDTHLFIPDGYGTGTILYDFDNKPFEVRERALEMGCNFRKVIPVESKYAEMRISQGANVLVSE